MAGHVLYVKSPDISVHSIVCTRVKTRFPSKYKQVAIDDRGRVLLSGRGRFTAEFRSVNELPLISDYIEFPQLTDLLDNKAL